MIARAALPLLFSLLLAASAGAAPKRAPAEIRSQVVRATPDFSFPGAGGKSRTLHSLRGQPVVVIVAESPRTKAFRKQLDRLRNTYSPFASRQTIFVAAFRQGEGPVRSDLPFVVASNGPAVADAYGVREDFNIIIIGKDGNIDYQTSKVLSPERIRDVIQNSFVVQREVRR
jgi:peroxiredoxin